jgi:hypothetical protein
MRACLVPCWIALTSTWTFHRCSMSYVCQLLPVREMGAWIELPGVVTHLA